MTWTVRDRRGHNIAVVTWSSVVLWAAQLASVLTMVALAAVNAPRSELWPAVVVMALASVAVAVPDSGAGLVTLLGYGAWWLVADRTAPWPAVLVVAVAGLVLHVSLAYAAAAPAGASAEPAVVRSVVLDLGVVVVVTGLAALAATVVDASGVRAPPYLIGVALVLIGLLPWVALDARSREARRR